jgi:hypothetical protein
MTHAHLKTWFVIAATMSSLVAASELCDQTLEPVVGSPFGYRSRGDRCEGIYVREVSGVLVVASMVSDLGEFDASSRAPINVAWSPPKGASEVRLRAQGLRRRLYYRMDSILPTGASNYTWPSDVLSGLGLGLREVGLIAWTRLPLGNETQRVIMPVRVGPLPQNVQQRTAKALYLDRKT